LRSPISFEFYLYAKSYGGAIVWSSVRFKFEIFCDFSSNTVVPPAVVAFTEYESILVIDGYTMTIDRYQEVETGDCLVNTILF
jgi:hypothetical protein